MVKIFCKTNLDINEKWPDTLPERPVVGDKIASMRKHKDGISIILEVVRTTWTYDKLEDCGYEVYDWYLEVELHDPLKRSIRDFYKWYAPLVGKSVESFI